MRLNHYIQLTRFCFFLLNFYVFTGGCRVSKVVAEFIIHVLSGNENIISFLLL